MCRIIIILLIISIIDKHSTYSLGGLESTNLPGLYFFRNCIVVFVILSTYNPNRMMNNHGIFSVHPWLSKLLECSWEQSLPTKGVRLPKLVMSVVHLFLIVSCTGQMYKKCKVCRKWEMWRIIEGRSKWQPIILVHEWPPINLLITCPGSLHTPHKHSASKV